MFVAVLLVLALTLAACGGGKQESPPVSSSGQSGGNTETSTATKPEAANPLEGATLTILAFESGTYDVALRQAAEEVKQQYGATINLVTAPYESLHEKEITALVTGTSGYDVMHVAYEWDSEVASFLEILDPYIQRDGYAIGDIYESVQKVVGYFDGYGRFGMPIAGTGYGLSYRTDLFAQANLQPPKTWAEYNEMAKVLFEQYGGQGIYGTTLTGVGIQEYKSFAARYWETGNVFLTSDWKAQYNNAAGVAALEQMRSILPYTPPGMISWDNPEVNAAFLNGTVAMAELWPSFIKPDVDNPDKSKVVGKAGFTPVPGGANLAAWHLAIPRTSQNKEAAWEFIKYFTSEKNVRRWHEQYGVSAVNKKVLKDYPLDEGILLGARGIPRVPWFLEWFIDLGKNLQDAMAGTKTSKQALDASVATWNRLSEGKTPTFKHSE